MQRIPNPTTTPDKAGSRAARTAHLSTLLIEWRKRNGLSREDAARIFCCSARTIAKWELRRCLPQGVSLPAVIAHIEGGAR
jgi:DNA-binding transcriptional regulator YiaG